MKTQGEYIRTLQRRVDFLKAREYRNSYDAAELGALEWALVNLPPQPAQRTWVGLTEEEILELNFDGEYCIITDDDEEILEFARSIEATLRSKNT